MKPTLCRYEMRLGLANGEKEHPGDLTGKTWTQERWDGINFVNKGAHWTEDRLPSIYPLLLPRLPPLVGDECWRKWLRKKKEKHRRTWRVKHRRKWDAKNVFCDISLCWKPELQSESDTRLVTLIQQNTYSVMLFCMKKNVLLYWHFFAL